MAELLNPRRRGFSWGARGCLVTALRLAVIVYAIQLVLVVHSSVVPELDRTVEGTRYRCFLWIGVPHYIPFVGLAGYIYHEPVMLIITDIQTGEERVESYDIVGDVLYEYPELRYEND